MPPNLTPRADSVPYALLARLRARGVATATVTLHVGPRTFLPVTTDDVDAHPMDAEAYDVPAATAAAIAEGQRHVLALDGKNPQTAARILVSFRSWRALEERRRLSAERTLRRIASTANLSRDVTDIVTRTLA